MKITLDEMHELYEKTYGGIYEKGHPDHPEGIYRHATFPYDEGSLWALCEALNQFLDQKYPES